MNANGVSDAGEPAVNWLVKVTNLDSNQFVYYTTPTTLQLPKGRYQICDMVPTQYNWVPTSTFPCAYVNISGGSECITYKFQCACLGPGGAKSASYWILGGGFATITEDDLAALRGLALKDGSGADFQPTTAAQFRTWYSQASAQYTSYYLSSQLALMTLNVRYFVNSNSQVKANAIGAFLGNVNGYPVLSNLLVYANILLQTNTELSMQMYLSAVLDQLNKDQNYVKTSPCPYTFNAVSPMAGSPADAKLTNVTCPGGATTGVLVGTTGGPTCEHGCLELRKVYDANGNGVTNAGEATIADWVFKVTNLGTGAWSYYTSPQQLKLPLGTYEVCDLKPLEFNWHSTRPSLCKIYVLTGPTCLAADGDCVCFGTGGTQSAGYWLEEGLGSITESDLAVLRGKFLVGATGAPFDPVTAAELAAWYDGATQGNWPYYLSAQLAISLLNTRHGVNGNSLVKAVGVAPLVGITTGLMTLEAMQEFADGLLSMATHDLNAMEAVAAALGSTNINKNFVQGGPCQFSFPELGETAQPLESPACLPHGGLKRGASGSPYQCCDMSGPACPLGTQLPVVAGSFANVVHIGQALVTETADEIKVHVKLADKCWQVKRVDQYLSTRPLTPDTSNYINASLFTYVKPLPAPINEVHGNWISATIPGSSKGCFDQIFAALHLELECGCGSCDGLSGRQDGWAAGTDPFTNGQFGYSHALRHCCDRAPNEFDLLSQAAPDVARRSAALAATDASAAKLLESAAPAAAEQLTSHSSYVMDSLFGAAVAVVAFAVLASVVKLRSRAKVAPAVEPEVSPMTSSPLLPALSVVPPSPPSPSAKEVAALKSAPRTLSNSLKSVQVLRLRNSNNAVRSPLDPTTDVK